MSIASWWNNAASLLSDDLEEGLLQGVLGGGNVHGLASQALREYNASHDSALATLGMQLLRWAWENAPMDADIARHLQTVAGDLLPPAVLRVVEAVIAHHHQPQRLDYLLRLLEKNDKERLHSYLRGQCAKEPDNLFWLQQALGSAAYDGDWSGAMAMLDAVRAPDLAPVVELLRADICYYSGEVQAAASRYGFLSRNPGFWAATLGQASAFHFLGKREESLEIRRAAAEFMPWHTTLLLQLHDALTGLDQAVGSLPGRVPVLLYTYNKAAELKKSLEALAASLPDNAMVFALDNGSSDATPEVLAAWSERLGERMRVVTLPVNIGAPAARNWLASLEEVRHCQWLAYVDDDAPVPADWLGRLAASVEAYPQASVWGCKVVDARNPCLLQHVDLHLRSPAEIRPAPDTPHYRRRFSLSQIQHQTLGGGQFSYCRPCATVTGCVHLLRRGALEQSGGFDLRFTPTQFDDLEHDLRLNLAGQMVVYQGHLTVPHFKRTGRAGRTDHKENARALANQYKLHQLFNDEEIARLRGEQRRILRRDLEEKLRLSFASDG